MNSRGSLIVVSGFSGAGKGTLMKNLVKRSSRYALSVSMTTREPRPGEVDGVSYFFVSQEEFDRTAQENGFLEHASYVGHSYGTPKAWVLEQMKKGRDVILEIDAQGAMQIKKIMPDAVLVFVVTPDAECLLNRLRGRGTECRDVIARRIRQAATEVEEIAGYDYLLVNDDLEQCTDDLEDIIRASHFDPHHNMELVENLKKGLHEILQRSQNSQ
ncbi:MAG: guanylate kinase [Lachnospiraceae bacterium]|nr:guanylate kinase [Lachnospiraceae bacterium]